MAHDYEVLDSEQVYEGKVIRVRRDTVRMPGGNSAQRDVVEHPGAVGIVAQDDQGRILLLRQYRHPVGEVLWELPAGILDREGEKALDTAKRELSEEAGLSAEDWHTLVDAHATPGASSEAFRVYLARKLNQLGEHEPGEDEEADLELEWLDLEDALLRVMMGEITNALAVIGILAVGLLEHRGFARLRPGDAAWPARPQAGGQVELR